MTDAAPQPHRRFPWTVMLALGAGALLLFLAGLTRDPRPYFDETHYVPAARALLTLDGPANMEHPLLGKELIALGIMLFGDNAFGWRFFATLAGSISVMAVFAIGWRLFGRTRPALVAGVLACTNFTLFVQARIGMIDTPMAALALLGIAALLYGARSRRAERWLALAGLCFGLGVAAKWAALPLLAGAGVALLIARRRGLFGGVGMAAALALFGGAAAFGYFATFAPAFFYAHDPMTPARLLPFQAEMYRQQTLPLAAHPYQSRWWGWSLDLRPIWYLYEPVDGVQRGVLMIGNPLVMWGGLAALGVCLVMGLRRRSWPLLAPVLFWAVAYLPWIAIPKKIGFFYYYYLPSIFLCLAIAAAVDAIGRGAARLSWWTVIASTALFVWFYPILSAAPLDGPRAFLRWMWLPSWP